MGLNHIHGGHGRPDRLHAFLERMRAGFGAAGVTAALIEGVSSTRVFSSVFGTATHVWVAAFAAAAFIAASYVIDVPPSRGRDPQE